MNLTILDKQKRILFKKFEVKRRSLISIRNNLFLTNNIRFQAQLLLNKLPRNSSVCRVRNRCVLSGRGRGVYKSLRISRIVLRDLVNTGRLSGFKKSSW